MAVTAVRFALDRSVRSFDADGRLHVARTNISKAVVNEYRGSEIPNADFFGLDADGIYSLLRDPDELRKGAASFNNLPLMDEHILVSADNPEKDRIVGSTGTDAEFDGEYLACSLVIWDADMIRRIESGEQKEISCAYRYTPVLREGMFGGKKYGLVMTDLIGNHVALVPAGRAGPDVVVGDSIGTAPMKLTSKKALMTQGALIALARPLVAADAKLGDISAKALEGVNRTNFKAMKPKIAAKFAADAKLDADGVKGLTVALDAMEKEDCGEDDNMDDPQATEAMDEEEEKKKKEAEDKAAKDKKARDKAAKDKKAKDDAETEEERERREKEEAEAEDKKAKDDKAMDAAIERRLKIATDAAVARVTTRLEAIAAAKDAVRPYVGEVAGLDSAAAIYKFALDAASVDLTDVPEAAFPAMLKMLPLPGAQVAASVAMDAETGGGDWFNSFVGRA